jgi:hypothetical protein
VDFCAVDSPGKRGPLTKGREEFARPQAVDEPSLDRKEAAAAFADLFERGGETGTVGVAVTVPAAEGELEALEFFEEFGPDVAAGEKLAELEELVGDERGLERTRSAEPKIVDPEKEGLEPEEKAHPLSERVLEGDLGGVGGGRRRHHERRIRRRWRARRRAAVAAVSSGGASPKTRSSASASRSARLA